MLTINGERLLERINALGAIGKDSDGRRTRLVATDEDKAGRDAVVEWMKDANLKVVVDRIGNIFGIWEVSSTQDSMMDVMEFLQELKLLKQCKKRD